MKELLQNTSLVGRNLTGGCSEPISSDLALKIVKWKFDDISKPAK
jgi:hypothetical protein